MKNSFNKDDSTAVIKYGIINKLITVNLLTGSGLTRKNLGTKTVFVITN